MADFIAKFNKLKLGEASKADEASFPQFSAEQKALAAQFDTLSTRFDEPESVVALNDSLRTKTFVTGNTPSKTDLVVFEKVLPLASKWTSNEDLAKHRHILRWADLVQNTLFEVPQDQKLTLNYDVELPREVKEKKKPAAAAAAPAAAAAAPAAAKEAPAKQAEAATGGKELTEEEKQARAAAAKAKKEAKAKAKAEQNAKQQAAAAPVPATPALIDFRVGFIQKAEKHPNADSLYVSTIDLGEETGPRTICSGLVKYVPLEDMQERYVVVIANLKPVAMRGIKSMGMVLCASNESTVEFVNPPAGSKAGDKLFFESFDGTPEKQLNPKKKVWETCQALFSTTENFEITYTEEGKEPKKLVNAKGEFCKNSTLVKADVK
ncbi:nucleic acid-binding protein [Suhomyces tanzawaensis NRRL Y-17324]|uniref:Nucleic acid-binding protein n=1 Tax=Suhomyces tanzawaensis NRRL Y-17324 TaxID=984487 RepID=A0A1E4SIU3_9ASCO|nr:nucleic acid-binding protein [Suhomyces tanzawaensis NRRL Y-17324]ODV79421.1 nucleic acid-binding protein [Suhomyces tanzawaensis NRRL Y-17324]